MVRVPGSSGDSGFHRESQEEVQVKTEQGNEMSSEARSTMTSLNARSAYRQSARRNSADGSEADLLLKTRASPLVRRGAWTETSCYSHITGSVVLERYPSRKAAPDRGCQAHCRRNAK
ncbi:hypothetical protein PHMEG_00020704 [Phytophthora megakarya]|uniref:Uncharacterized protein n=1 Tax=Phytophthora megakarya TaxID=4795 RepID=A0A225VPL5_9STRA|nr:hypothetical protein PHMEG_00020704 [Phytophthora megakarya]